MCIHPVQWRLPQLPWNTLCNGRSFLHSIIIIVSFVFKTAMVSTTDGYGVKKSHLYLYTDGEQNCSCQAISEIQVYHSFWSQDWNWMDGQPTISRNSLLCLLPTKLKVHGLQIHTKTYNWEQTAIGGKGPLSYLYLASSLDFCNIYTPTQYNYFV